MPADSISASPRPLAAPSADAPLAIQVKNLHKTFRIPTNRVDSLKERVVKPFAAREYRELHALDDVSFDIRKGEFFGIVGRNGSGKSTLLKLLASIYQADRGTIRMAGRLAPFIELGVGFNQDLTARQNVILNGVLMGLTPKEMRQRLGAVIEFAELEEFADMKLKNYSSGMLVRLAFSVMMEADADILLIDEVLAVGDASFQQKCADAFNEMKAKGKTIVLVTHEMATVDTYCHRAMLISEGKIQHIGDPAEVGREYLRLNFEEGDTSSVLSSKIEDLRLIDLWMENAAGAKDTNLEQGEEIRLRCEVEVLRETPAVLTGFTIANEQIGFFQFSATTEENEGPLRPEQRVVVDARIENLLSPGRYYLNFGAKRYPDPRALILHVEQAVTFHVLGVEPDLGIVTLPHTIETSVVDPTTR